MINSKQTHSIIFGASCQKGVLFVLKIQEVIMARRKKGQLASGNIRVQVYDYTDADGKRHYQSFTAPTRAEAEAKANDWKEQRRQLKESLTVSEAVKQYIDLKEAVLSPATVRMYRSAQRTRFGGKFGTIDLRNIQNTDIQLWVSKLSEELSPKTVKNLYALLTAVMGVFVPDFAVKATLPPKKKTMLYCPSFDDVMLLYQRAKSRELKIAILLGSVCAMRRGEVCAVGFSDLSGDYLTINKAYVLNDKKEWVLKSPKTYDSYRRIRIPEMVKNAILSLPYPHTGRIVPLKPDVLSNRFARALRSSGLPHFRYHDLRHFGASMLAGFGDRYVEAYGGWKPGSNVMKRVYQNLIDVEKVRTEKEMSDMFQEKLVQHATRNATR